MTDTITFVVIAGGVENMSRVLQGVGAEMIAQKWVLSRTQLDEFALRSHELSAAATDAGAFGKQLAPIAGLTSDEASAAATPPNRSPGWLAETGADVNRLNPLGGAIGVGAGRRMRILDKEG